MAAAAAAAAGGCSPGLEDTAVVATEDEGALGMELALGMGGCRRDKAVAAMT